MTKMTVEEYAIKLLTDGGTSHAEDDTNEEGLISDEFLLDACDMARAMARAIQKDPHGFLRFFYSGTRPESQDLLGASS